jgi:hypothetical protein
MRSLQHQVVKAILISSLVGCGFSPGMPGESLPGSAASSGSGTGTGTGGGGVTGSGGVGLSGGGGVSATSGGGGDVGMGTGGVSCGQSSVQVMPEPPDILILQDRSLSMTMDPSGKNCNGTSTTCSKWSQVSTAVVAVVNSPAGASVNWGLKFFGNDKSTTCGIQDGAAVDIAPAATSAPAITTSFGATTPQTATPTTAALNSAVKYLQSVTDTNPKFILLATDGLPTCGAGGATSDDSTNAEAAVTAAVAAGFKVFVVGIGDTMGDATLNIMAMNGGEPQVGAATSFYSVSDTTSLETALTNIIGLVASCTIPLTGVPANLTNVAVSVDDSSGNPTKVPEDPANGWSYTDTTMTTIQLNGSYCDSIKSGTYSNIQFVYSCDGQPICIDKLANGQCGDAS